MSGFLKKLKTTKEPSSPRYIPPPLECPKCTFTTHTRITLKKHIESQHSPNYAQKSPKLVKCPYCKEKVPDLNNHVQSLHPHEHEEELRTGYRPLASPSKGGKRNTLSKRRSNRKTKRKSRISPK
jgi:hypothetical protein